MMADLMGQHVSLCEIAGGAEPVFQFLKEAEIDINALVGRAIERACGRLGKAAARLHSVAEEHEAGVLILHSFTSQQLAPGALGIIEHKRHELHLRLFIRVIYRSGTLAGGYDGRARSKER